MRRHEIPIILSGPSRRTLIGSRDHHMGATWLHVANSARCFVLEKIVLKAMEWRFVLSTMYWCSALPSTVVLVIYGIVGETDVVGAATRVSVVSITHHSCKQRDKTISTISKQYMLSPNMFALLEMSIVAILQVVPLFKKCLLISCYLHRSWGFGDVWNVKAMMIAAISHPTGHFW